MLQTSAEPPATPARRRAPKPLDAASLILIDRRGTLPRVLMGRRHEGHAFMPGRWVFPGGRLDPADRLMRAYGTLSAPTERGLIAGVSRGTTAKARALALCAIRETAEETGLLVGEAGLGAPPTAPAAWQAFVTHEVFPSLEALHLVARAITPPTLPRRFDARFFAADAEAIVAKTGEVVGPDGELVELKWLSFDETRHENLAEITRLILSELEARLEAGLDADRPVPFFAERHGRWSRGEL